MAIWTDIEGAATTPVADPAVVTIGVFDGVHRGHRTLIDEARREADERGAVVVAVTFWPHPVAVLAPDRAPVRLTSIERRVELLHEAGADHVRVLAFSRDLAAWDPERFIDEVVMDQCHAVHVVVGENFRFGAKAAGDVALLGAAGAQRGFTVTGVELTGDSAPFSSTRARQLLADGDVVAVSAILGRPHEVAGEVVHGDHRGAQLGFPTANVLVDDAVAAPADGVYACWLVRADGSRLPAATSVGTNPTFAGVAGRRVESYVLDRDDLDLYGEHVRVEFVERLREMTAFDDVDALVQQMRADVDAARTILRG